MLYVRFTAPTLPAVGAEKLLAYSNVLALF